MQKRTAFITALLAVAVATCRNDGGRAPTELKSPLASVVASPAAVTLVGAGDISSCTHHNDQSTAKLLDTIPGTVFTTGDNAAPSGSSTDYANCYDPTWGRQKARTYPAPGDLEYQTAGAAGYFGYFGAAAGDPTKGYYSYTLGTWHIVVLNSQISMALGSAQEQWLKADLAANSQQCTLAYWHLPLFYSGATANTRSSVKPLWDDLYAAGAEIVLNSHTRNYERFAPQRPNASADSIFGIREFIVGTGGLGTWAFGPTAPNSEVRGQIYGVLRLTLDSLRYSWQFVTAGGSKFADSGSGVCHAAPIPVANPGGPYTGEGAITFDGSTSFSPEGYTPLTYAWTFGDGTTGTGLSPSHTYAAAGTYTVTLTVTDAHGTVSAPATTTALVQNFPPIVNAGPDVHALPGQAVQVTGNFTDLGTNGPWAYQILWGDGTTSAGSTPSQGAFRVNHTYAQVGLDSVRVTVTDAGGTSGADTLAVLVEPPGTPETLLIAGDIAECAASGDEATANLLDGLPGVVFTAGDNTYPNGAAADYASCYALTWGRHRNRTYATLGNHDYGLGNANGTWDYFGSGAGDRGAGYYSVNLGSSWHVVVLNSNYTFVPTALGSAQEQWLRADLAAASGKCIVAIWHHPKFYSSTESPLSAGSITNAFWDDLYAAHADLIVNGHMHSYERFAQVNPAGSPDPNGIREIIAGTGGAWPDATDIYFWPTSQTYIGGVWGVLQLTLNTGSYSWRFVPAAGDTATDAGTAACHNAPPQNTTPPTAAAGGPYTGTEGAAIAFDGSGSSAAAGGTLSYAWDFGDGTTGSGMNPVHAYGDNGSYTVTLTVTDGSGLTGTATATATVANAAPTVAAGTALNGTAGSPVNLSVAFGDAGTNDGPWTYGINWGDGTAPTTGSTSSTTAPITASHTYGAAGTDTIVVTVTDKDGGTGSASTTAAIVAANRAPTAVAGGPYPGNEGAVVTFSGSGSSDPDGDALTYAWTFGDGGTATGSAPTHTYADNGTYTVTLTVTDSHGALSAPASTAATIANVAPAVTAPAALAANAGTAVALAATFSDPGAGDAPWTYTINWGDGSLPTTGTASVAGAVGGSHAYAAAGVFTAVVTVTDKDGSGGSAQTTVTVTQQQVATVTALIAGNIARCDRTNDEATEAVLDTIPGSVMVLGDNAYPNGTAANFQTCYNPSWGRVLPRTYPVVGNHEYDSSATAAPYFAYFGAVAGNAAQGYYSFDLGAWHIVVLNSNNAFVSTAAGSAQETWLRNDLAASTKKCQLALFHHPRFYSTTATSFSPTASVKAFWDDLYAAGAELIVNAHMQDYERFAPQTSAGAADPANGIREMVVGTGGAGLDAPNTLIIANSEARISGVYGVLKLTLADGSYSWQFLPVAGQTATDSGSGTCH